MAVQILVQDFTLTNTVTPKAGGNTACIATIDNVKLENFEFSELGPPARRLKFPFVDDAGNEQTDIPRWLVAVGWNAGEMAGGGDAGPTSFNKWGNFTSLHVSYRAPVTCSCPPGRKTTRHLRMEVDYDRTSNGGPDLRVTETTEDGTPLDPQDAGLKVKVVDQRVATTQHPDTAIMYARFYVSEEIKAKVACPCDPNSPCEVTFTLNYNYVTKIL